jgi:hypothetical protein
MAIDVKEYSKLTGLNETAAAQSIARGDAFAAWRIPGGAANIESKDAMEDVLEEDTSNDTVVTVVVDDETGDVGGQGMEDESSEPVVEDTEVDE